MAAPRRAYASANGCTAHYRTCGSGPPVILLHDSPRSSRVHLATMEALADRFTVFALDTPGYGNSPPLEMASPAIPDFAEALGLVLEAMGLAHAPVYATHTSAKIALALAVRGGKMARLVLDGLALPEQVADEAYIAAYMRPFVTDDAGAYLATEWTRMRDMLRWFPWFDQSARTRLATSPPPREWLADFCMDLMSAGPHYSDAYAAAMRWNPMPDLMAVKVPTIVSARPDDVLAGYLDRVPSSGNPAVSVARPDGDRLAWLNWLGGALSDALPQDAPLCRASAPKDVRSAQAGYVDLPHGQLHWQRIGSGSPVLVLSAPTTLQALQWAGALSGEARAIVPDLPGFGESDPLPAPDADAMADALAALVRDLGAVQGLGALPVIACGMAAPLGAALAIRHPGVVSHLVIDGAPPLDNAAARRFHGLYPPIDLDMEGGGHLHRLWHMLRDGELHWPWHDRSPALNRMIEPQLSGTQLHRAMVGVLKSSGTWGQACDSAAAASSTELWAAIKVPTTLFAHADPAHADAPAIARLIAGARLLDRPENLSLAGCLR